MGTAGGLAVADEVWVMAGLRVPVALRRLSDRRYAVVGYIYVHGIMHGESLLNETDIVEINLVQEGLMLENK